MFYFSLISVIAPHETDKPIWESASLSALFNSDSGYSPLGIEGPKGIVFITENGISWSCGNGMRKFCKTNCSVLVKGEINTSSLTDSR